MQLYPYQIEGADLLASRTRMFCGDEMGLGKSAQAITASRLIGATDITVVCPASVRAVWRHEFKLWRPDVQPTLLTSYAKHKEVPDGGELLILDEAHYLKTPSAQRTRKIYGTNAVNRWDYIWALSGTPAPNHIGEMWTHCNVMGGTDLSYHQWIDRYCITAPSEYPPGYRIVRSKGEMAAEIREKMAPWFFRRKLSDVSIQLPPLRWAGLPMASTPAAQAMKEIPPKTDLLCADIDLEAIARRPHIASVRRATADAKTMDFALWLSEEIYNGLGKVIVFGYHRAPLERLNNMLKESVLVYGGTPEGQREEAVRSFQEDPEVKVFLGQIESAGTGITLTAADRVVFFESDWSPANMVQAAKRCHRIGQDRPVLVQVLTLQDSIDEAIQGTLIRKARDLSNLQLGVTK